MHIKQMLGEVASLNVISKKKFKKKDKKL